MAKKPSLDDVWGLSDLPPARERPPAAGPAREKPRPQRDAAERGAAPPARRRAAKKTARPQPADKPVRMTVYLDPSVAELLDRAQIELKRLTGIRGHSTSNSAVVEECLKVVLDHFLQKPENSELPTLISRRERERQKSSRAEKG